MNASSENTLSLLKPSRRENGRPASSIDRKMQSSAGGVIVEGEEDEEDEEEEEGEGYNSGPFENRGMEREWDLKAENSNASDNYYTDECESAGSSKRTHQSIKSRIKAKLSVSSRKSIIPIPLLPEDRWYDSMDDLVDTLFFSMKL